MDYGERERTSLMLALAVILLGAITIIAFIYTSGGLTFYILMAITLAIAFYFSYRISGEEETKPRHQPRKARKRGRK